MEIKAKLQKPYTERQRVDFITENNQQKGFEIKETDKALEAWGYTDAELLEKAKAEKYTEACTKAYAYLNGGEAAYELSEGISIEASDGNISKLTSCMLDLGRQEAFAGADEDVTKIIANFINIFKGKISGKTVSWTSKEDKVIDINVLDAAKILKGIKAIQSAVWSVKFPGYKKRIDDAESIEAVDCITIEY